MDIFDDGKLRLNSIWPLRMWVTHIMENLHDINNERESLVLNILQIPEYRLSAAHGILFYHFDKCLGGLLIKSTSFQNS